MRCKYYGREHAEIIKFTKLESKYEFLKLISAHAQDNLQEEDMQLQHIQ